jgi:hypothetical protein
MSNEELRTKIEEILFDGNQEPYKAFLKQVQKDKVDQILALFSPDELVKRIEGEKKDYCPSCHNNEQDNPNNWCGEYEEQRFFNDGLDKAIEIIRELGGKE